MKKIYFAVLFFFICISSFTQTTTNSVTEKLNTDSILFHKKKSIELYEADTLKDPATDPNICLSYIYIVKDEVEKKKPDFVLINDYMTKARMLAELHNLQIVYIQISSAQSLINLAQNNIKQAEKQALYTHELINNYRHLDYQQLYIENYSLLDRIYEAKGDYKTALLYNNLRSEYELESRNNEIRTIELQSLEDKKEAEIAILKTRNAFHKKAKVFFAVASILLFITTILLALLLSVKRKNLKHFTNSEKLKKDDAELKLKLKNEQTKKTLLEKHEALSNFHLKEMELTGKSRDIRELESKKKELDKQIDLLAKKIAEYEYYKQRAKKANKKEQPLYNTIRADIELLICKHLPDTNEYLCNLGKINDLYIDLLRERHDGHISAQYIKYCICFAIGLEINEVAECFSIESASVHSLRYKLKKKFGLGAEDSLELFLKSLIINTA